MDIFAAPPAASRSRSPASRHLGFDRDLCDLSDTLPAHLDNTIRFEGWILRSSQLKRQTKSKRSANNLFCSTLN
jgi:hypothetical protein